jgi:hypothetical protein
MKRQVFALLIPVLAILVAVFPNARNIFLESASSIIGGIVDARHVCGLAIFSVEMFLLGNQEGRELSLIGNP